MTGPHDGYEADCTAATPVMRRRAAAVDLPGIVAIHRSAYSRSHFTSLLSAATLERYYAGFLGDGTQITVATNGTAIDARLLGFAVYGTGIPQKIAAFKRSCARDILMTSLRHPWTAGRKVLKAVRSRLSGHVAVEPAEFLLLSIAVAPKTSGVGAQLLRDLLAAARNAGHEKVGLYVNDDNLRAINAYHRAGFRMRELHSGQYYMDVALTL